MKQVKRVYEWIDFVYSILPFSHLLDIVRVFSLLYIEIERHDFCMACLIPCLVLSFQLPLNRFFNLCIFFIAIAWVWWAGRVNRLWNIWLKSTNLILSFKTYPLLSFLTGRLLPQIWEGGEGLDIALTGGKILDCAPKFYLKSLFILPF